MREDLRGTYAGLASEAAIEHLRSLGVTAVELMPVHHFVDEASSTTAASRTTGATRSIGYFAPHAAYAATGTRGEQVREFKAMVKALHRAGHRGDPRRRLQPHRRGQPPRADALASAASTTLLLPAVPDDPRFYIDFTGTGNTLNRCTRACCG